MKKIKTMKMFMISESRVTGNPRFHSTDISVFIP